MTGKLARSSYVQLVEEDLAWLRQQPRTLERDHIIQIVQRSPVMEYDRVDVLHTLARCTADLIGFTESTWQVFNIPMSKELQAVLSTLKQLLTTIHEEVR